jgi:hypothetical protein
MPKDAYKKRVFCKGSHVTPCKNRQYGALYFSTLDMYKGCHQVRVKERDTYETAFRTHNGLFEYCVLPFVLCNAPAGFQAMMNRVLAPYIPSEYI